jgi:hypothetical protein
MRERVNGFLLEFPHHSLVYDTFPIRKYSSEVFRYAVA